MDNAGCIGGDVGAVGAKSDSEAVERVPPLMLVVVVVTKKARSRDINGLEDIGENLANFLTSSSAEEPMMVGNLAVALANSIFASSGVVIVACEGGGAAVDSRKSRKNNNV